MDRIRIPCIYPTKEVIDKWACGGTGYSTNKDRTMTYDDPMLISYDTTIAIRVYLNYKTGYFLNTKRYSSTTSKQQCWIRSVVARTADDGFVFHLNGLRYARMASHIDDYTKEILFAIDKWKRARNKAKWASLITNRASEADRFAEFYGLPDRMNMIDDYNAWMILYTMRGN